MTLSRRSLLAALPGAALAAAAVPVLASPSQAVPTARPLVKPARLRRGDVVGLIDPASATWERVDVEIAVESLAVLGLEAKLGEHLLDRRGYFAGPDENRARDLNRMFADPDVKAIHCLRGGWGSARLLPLIDFDAVARSPKILLGYSDITALVLSMHARTGLVTFHGPNGASQWNPFNVGWFKRVLMDGEAVTFENVREVTEKHLTQVEHRVQTITPGRARGRLLGGNLTVLTTMLGSGFVPDWREAVLFLEDVNEAPYRIDRMLTQLGLAGILGQARAIVWGTCSKCTPGEGYGSLTLEDVLDDHVKPLGVPAWQGAMIGHIDRQFTLPIGVGVEVDATAGTIRMLEPAVI